MDKLSSLLTIKDGVAEQMFRGLATMDLEEISMVICWYKDEELDLLEKTLTSHCTLYSVGWDNQDSFAAIDLKSLWFLALVAPTMTKFMRRSPDTRVSQAINMASGEYGLDARRMNTTEHMTGLAIRRLFDPKSRYPAEHLYWIGQNADRILEQREVIERCSDLSPEFCKELFATAPALTEGIL